MGVSSRLVSSPLIITVILVFAGSTAAIQDANFGELDPAAPNQIVLMYKSGEEKSDIALEEFVKAEFHVQESGVAGADRIVFKKCDANEGNNQQQMSSKGLTGLPMVFVSIEGQGMDRYARELTGEKLADFILVKLEPTTDEDIFPFSDDLITDQYPVFVKFYEKWCSRCSAMKKAYENAASQMVGRVIFMEVECSSSDTAQAFCMMHKVDGYPTLKLMGGEFEKAVPFERDRSVQGILEFLNEHVPEEEGEEEEEVEESEGGRTEL